MPQKKPKRYKALAIAETQLGVTEVPAGSNWGPKVKEYLKAAEISVPAPWCAAFTTWCFEKAGKKLTFPGQASVGFWETWAKKTGQMAKVPMPADLICYRFDADNWPDHIGFVVKVLAFKWRNKVFVGYVKTIEGNTAYGNDANGGKVMYRWRWCGSNTSFLRIED